ncbi:LysM peptidoglycan-binding domain-containing protein [Candidatus Omnitrophota bacterium]
MKKFVVYSLLFAALAISGCVARLTPYEADRVDQELKGNRGMVKGATSTAPEARKKTRKMYNLEIELPAKNDKEPARKDVAIKGNRGYLVGDKALSKTAAPVKKETGVKKLFPPVRSDKPRVVYQTPASTDGKYEKEKGSGTVGEGEAGVGERIYIVEKGDTLQKISDKAYGTTKKWKKIFEANKNTLKSPDKIKPGQELVIPE